MYSLSRRDFLKGSAAIAAAASLPPLLQQTTEAALPPNNGGPNDQLRVAVIGVRGRGRAHVGGFAGRNNCIVTHVCDCDSGVVGPAINSAARAQGGRRPEFVQDLRRIMDNRDIDIVSIATPNHWHALGAIWAMQNGKHVYVEKPVSHNVWEGRRIVEISRSTNKLCQAGTQIRSASGARQAIEYIHSGELGRVRVARGLCYKPRGTIRTAGAQGGEIPETINYDLWCGPAPVQRPMRRIRLHYDWHWTWDYGNGDLGNQGIHQMDVARWALNQNQLSNSVVSLGGRFGYEDDGETANTQMAVFEYPNNAQLIFEVRGLRTGAYRDARIGNVIHCENGIMVFTSYSSAVAFNNDGEMIRRFSGGGDHFANFVQAVRANRRQNLNGEILEGHLSSALCHLANISYRMGSDSRFSNQIAAFRDNEAAQDTFERMRSHLSDNNVPVNTASYKLGPTLEMNPETERFTNNERANAQLTREYRRGFEVPARG